MSKKIRNIIILAVVIIGGFIAAVAGYNTLSGKVDPAGGGTFADAISVYDESVASGKSSTEPGKNQVQGTGKAAADFIMLDEAGENIHLSDHFGSPIVLNFWTTWCPPCRAEMPALDKAFKENGDIVDFMIVNLTDGYRDTKDGAEEYVQEDGYGFPVYFDTAGNGAKTYNIISIPTTVFIKKDGTILKTHMGALSEGKLEEYIGELLK